MGSPWIVWQGTHCPSLPSGQVWLLILKIFRLIWSFLVLYCDDFESSITTYLDFMTTRFYHQQKHQPQKKTINLQPSINHSGTTIINLPTPNSSHSWKPEVPWKHPSIHHNVFGSLTLPFPDRTRDLANILRVGCRISSWHWGPVNMDVNQTIKNDPFTISCRKIPEVEWIICNLLVTSWWMSSATLKCSTSKNPSCHIDTVDGTSWLTSWGW